MGQLNAFEDEEVLTFKLVDPFQWYKHGSSFVVLEENGFNVELDLGLKTDVILEIFWQVVGQVLQFNSPVTFYPFHFHRQGFILHSHHVPDLTSALGSALHQRIHYICCFNF